MRCGPTVEHGRRHNLGDLQSRFDCNIYVQSLINPKGPAARFLEFAKQGRVLLFVSKYVITEVREIYLKTPAKYAITAAQTDELARAILSFGTFRNARLMLARPTACSC